MSELNQAVRSPQRLDIMRFSNVVCKYNALTNNGDNPYFIHLNSMQMYYVGSVMLDCTNTRGGHEAERYMVAYGPVFSHIIVGNIPTPYIRDLDEFLNNFIPAGD